MQHYDAAMASYLSYCGRDEIISTLTESASPWQLLQFVEERGYRGIALVHAALGVIIVAHRGTVPSNLLNILEDLRLIIGTTLDAQALAFDFSARLRQAYPQHKVVETGHSLGSVYAEINAVRFMSEAVTFDGPGCEPFVRQWCSAGEVNLKTLITHYLSAPSPINSLHPQIGSSIRLYVPHDLRDTNKTIAIWRNLCELNRQGAKQKEGLGELFLKYYLNQHAMKNLLQCFDPKIGYPYLQRAVASWPTRELLLSSSSFYLTLLTADLTDDRSLEEMILCMPGLQLGHVITPHVAAQSSEELLYLEKLFSVYDHFHRNDHLREARLKHLSPYRLPQDESAALLLKWQGIFSDLVVSGRKEENPASTAPESVTTVSITQPGVR